MYILLRLITIYISVPLFTGNWQIYIAHQVELLS